MVATIQLKEMTKDKTTYRYPSDAVFFAQVKRLSFSVLKIINWDVCSMVPCNVINCCVPAHCRHINRACKRMVIPSYCYDMNVILS